MLKEVFHVQCKLIN